MTAPIATLTGACNAGDCGGPLEAGPQTLATATVIRHWLRCTTCGAEYLATVTLRRATPADRDPWHHDDDTHQTVRHQ